MICVSVNFDVRRKPAGWLKMPESFAYGYQAGGELTPTLFTEPDAEHFS